MMWVKEEGWAWESERSGLVAERTKKTENI